MKKYLYFLPCLALSLILLFNNFYKVDARDLTTQFFYNDYYIFDVGDNTLHFNTFNRDGSVEYTYRITTNCDTKILVYCICSQFYGDYYRWNVYFLAPTDSTFSSSYVQYLNGSIFNSGSLSTSFRSGNTSLKAYCMYDGSYQPMGHRIADSLYVNDTNYTLAQRDPSSVEVMNEFVAGTLESPIDPDEIGGINNPESNPAIGNLKNMQSSAISFNYQTWDKNGKDITTSFDINFKWDSSTTNNYNLSDYSIQYFGNGTINNRQQGGSIQSRHISFTNNSANFNKSFNNEYSFSIPWTDILDVGGISYATDVNSTGIMPIGYSSPDFVFYFRPVLQINGKYYAGGWTKLNLNYNNETNQGSISTENVDIDTSGITSSNNQSGTGTNNNITVGDKTDSFGNNISWGNISQYDFNTFSDTTNSILQQVSGIPRIFGLVFSWLPSWVLDMFALMISFLILGIMISFIIKVVT